MGDHRGAVEAFGDGIGGVPFLGLVGRRHEDGHRSAAADDAEFETWWKAYPRKTAKGNARAPYRTARKKVSAEVLLDAAGAYAKSIAGKDPKFTAHAATWLSTLTTPNP